MSIDIAFDYKVTSPGVVLDVGGFNGEFVDFAREKYQCGVHTFEPSKEKFCELLQKYKSDPLVYPYNVALEDADSEMILFGTNNSRSLHMKAEAQESVKVRDIWGFITSFKLPKIDILKLNCEGSEYKILWQLHSQGFLSCIGNIVVQWHDIGPDSTRDYECLKLALEQHFTLKFNCTNSKWQWWEKK